MNLFPQSTDLTELARQGELDPTIGRDEGVYIEFSSKNNLTTCFVEIRRTIQSM